MDEARIRFVLLQFAHMGMDDAAAAREEELLRGDAAHYDAWCARIHEWCTPCPEEFWPEEEGAHSEVEEPESPSGT